MDFAPVRQRLNSGSRTWKLPKTRQIKPKIEMTIPSKIVSASALVAVAASALMSGCTYYEAAPAHPHHVVVVEGPSNPPPPQVEVIGVAPYYGAHWVRGHYVWRYHHWVWIRGHWSHHYY